MAEKKHFVVLGLGMFGSTLAERLSQNGCRVTGVDISEERVNRVKDVLYEAVIADATERASLEQLSISSADAIVISLGDTIVPSLLATLHAKELGACRLIVKGLDEDHAKLLTYLDVERVIFPKIDVAKELADRMTWPNIIDFIPIDPDYSLVEITVPQSWRGHTLTDIDLRRQLFAVISIGGLTTLLVLEQSTAPHPQSQDLFLGATFEIVSALGTVGLSTGLTPHLTAAGRIVMILLMIIGRLGPISVVVALSRRARPEVIELPQEEPLIG